MSDKAMPDNTQTKSPPATDPAWRKFENHSQNEKWTGSAERGLALELDELRRQSRAAEVALGNVGRINPRRPGLHNDAIQMVKRLIGRSLNWYTRPLRECLAGVVASLNETDKILEALNAAVFASLNETRKRLDALNERVHDLEFLRQYLPELSQQRWKGSEPDANLTWGEILTGDSFIDAIQAFYRFDPIHHICEVGPGYGRLLHTILERRLPFRRYTAVELSAERVRMLREKFADPRVEFVQGDVDQIQFAEHADLVICSSTFEHLYPDFTTALRNISSQLKPQGCLAIDFVQADPRMEHRQQGFEPRGHAFVRIYSKEEIQSLFTACGLTGLQVGSIVLGKVSYGDINRIFVFVRH
jgi:SAM-dependent methyltransferase